MTVHDFGSAGQETVEFKIQGQTYQASGRNSPFMHAMEASAAQAEAAAKARDTGLGNEATAYAFSEQALKYLERRLLPESWERFKAATESNEPEEYLDVSQVFEVYRWLLGQGGANRPTNPPDDSLTSSGDSGQSSMLDSPSTPASTPEPSATNAG